MESWTGSSDTLTIRLRRALRIGILYVILYGFRLDARFGRRGIGEEFAVIPRCCFLRRQKAYMRCGDGRSVSLGR
jgi:hypothetical protein